MPNPRALPEKLKLTGRTKKELRYKEYGDSSLVAFPKDATGIVPTEKLSAKATKAWDLVVPSLLKMQILAPADLPILEQGFVALDECYKAEAALKEFDKKYKDVSIEDKIKKRQQIRAWYRQSLEDITKVFSKFGLSPVDRAHLTMPKKEEEDKDPLEILLSEDNQ